MAEGWELLEEARRIACKAGCYIRESMPGLRQVDYKGRANLVTSVDRGSEEIIVQAIRQLYPDHAVLAEETGANAVRSDYCWIIDPIDGTTNFVHDYPFFCVSIALQYRQETVVAVVYDPTRDELFSALKGHGAWLNEQPIHVSKTTDLSDSLLATGFPYALEDRWHRSMDYFKLFYYRTHGVRRDGAAALDLCYVASGRFDGFWEYELQPWDVAAGLLLVTEAGGRVTDFAGHPAASEDRQLVASNGAIHAQMLDVLATLPECLA